MKNNLKENTDIIEEIKKEVISQDNSEELAQAQRLRELEIQDSLNNNGVYRFQQLRLLNLLSINLQDLRNTLLETNEKICKEININSGQINELVTLIDNSNKSVKA